MIYGIPLREIIAFALMGLGLVFLIGSAIGMLRLPDFYSRVHASGNSETLGTALVFLGLAVYNGFNDASFKIIVIFLFVVPSASVTMLQAVSRTASTTIASVTVRDETRPRRQER